MHNRIQSFMSAFILAFALVSSAAASPVTTKDISGKKICWDNGNISTFSPGGHYSSPVVGDGFWSVAPGGVAISAAGFNGLLDVDKQPGGKFTSQREGGAGRYCK